MNIKHLEGDGRAKHPVWPDGWLTFASADIAPFSRTAPRDIIII